jgi:hypothetical protein
LRIRYENEKVIGTFAVASVALALFVRWRQSSELTMNLGPGTAVGEVLAGEAGRLPVGTGKVVVIGHSSAKDGQSAHGEQISSFGSAMGRRGAAPTAITTRTT